MSVALLKLREAYAEILIKRHPFEARTPIEDMTEVERCNVELRKIRKQMRLLWGELDFENRVAIATMLAFDLYMDSYDIITNRHKIRENEAIIQVFEECKLPATAARLIYLAAHWSNDLSDMCDLVLSGKGLSYEEA